MDRVERRRARADRALISQRNYRRARDRALTKLAIKHREEYLELLGKEKALDEAQGKIWTNIAGDNSASVGAHAYAQPNGSATQEDEGEHL